MNAVTLLLLWFLQKKKKKKKKKKYNIEFMEERCKPDVTFTMSNRL